MTKYCFECQSNQQHTRGLCATCYSMYRREGKLDDWPTQKYLDYPDGSIRYTLDNDMETLERIVGEYNLVLADNAEIERLKQIIRTAGLEQWI